MGATASMLWWPDAFCEGLAAGGRQMIRFDNRDTGRSETVMPGESAYTMDDLADDVIGILEGYRLSQAHLAGMSLGGMIAQLVALKHPERVASLTLISTSAYDEYDESLPPMDSDVLAQFEKVAALNWRDRAAVIAFNVETMRLCANDPERFDAQAAYDLAALDYDRAINPASAMNHSTLTGSGDWAGHLKDISQPALVIHGRKDPVLSLAHGEKLAKGLNSRLVMTPGGHELNAADLPLMVREILDHTAGQASRASAK